MNPDSTLNPRKTLEGVHGVHLVPHSPFAVEEIPECRDFHLSTSDGSSIEANQQLLVRFRRQIWQQRPACLRPIRCNLHGIVRIFFNLVVWKNLTSKLYANSLVGVGVASSLYHSSKGKLRKYLRWADYTMIATSTVCLSGALRTENPKVLMAASAFFLPIQPLMVSAVHTGLMEVSFAKRAMKEPHLRIAHNVHKMSSLLGGVLFIADDLFPRTPYLHAAWHLAAAVGVGMCNKLLE
ncbi:hypothetical protein HHK36_029968 [Tetracentron sinense]|uniref:Uncharacterized protein n=1 Tax=Tetracentron sinense TaxID=13715 RepID=A0A834YAK5_TETSI|nr:hypothetical protein HHK36_029968 [Tetracentron sinense]